MVPARLPLLLAVVGAPGSGKTTLAKALADAVRLPCLHRDDFWIGLLRGRSADPSLPPPTGEETSQAFIDTVTRLLALGVSCIADDNLMARDPVQLASLAAVSRCVLLRTSCPDSDTRFAQRVRSDPVANDGRVLAAMRAVSVEHVIASQQPSAAALARTAMAFQTTLPLLDVDTRNGYQPALDQIVDFALQPQNRIPQ